MLNTPFTLPCGVVIPNRLAKSATTERLGRGDGKPNELHCQLYDRWADTQAGILITGNVMVDEWHLENAGNVTGCHSLDDDDGQQRLQQFQKWAHAGQQRYQHPVWVQLSHAGRQTPRFVNLHPYAPSEVQLHKMGLFGKPRMMPDPQLVVDQFVVAAQLCQAAGFAGLQIHAAHGYLISQFLSSGINHQRTDQWGGRSSLPNRARLLLEIVRAIRKQVGPRFPISVKLNSSDYRRGQLTQEESLQIVQMLAQQEEPIDLLEVSGGTYEKVVFFEQHKDEAYFVEFCRQVRHVAPNIPIMLTGGIRSYACCQRLLESGDVDMIGMARPFCTNDPSIFPAFLRGEVPELAVPTLPRGLPFLQDSAELGYHTQLLVQLAHHGMIDPQTTTTSVVWNFLYVVWVEIRNSLARRWYLYRKKHTIEA
jgi:2,4-dienoyl-CoA reductase-like NADH-dependent reductase (Old Yellow Enzyme family)